MPNDPASNHSSNSDSIPKAWQRGYESGKRARDAVLRAKAEAALNRLRVEHEALTTQLSAVEEQIILARFAHVEITDADW